MLIDSDSDDDDVNMYDLGASQYEVRDEGQGSGRPANQIDSSEGDNDTWVSKKLGEAVSSDSEVSSGRAEIKYPSFFHAPFG